MIEPTSAHASSDGLWRWLIGGLAAGALILGLLVAAYALGYNRGQHHGAAGRGGSPTAATTPVTTAPAATTAPVSGPITVTPALVARGKSLFSSGGCAACHSLTGSAGVGPSLKGLNDSTVTLDNGDSVTADDAYLQRSITDPDAEVVKGYRAGVMSAAISSLDLTNKPDDIRALIAFIKAQR